jgi:PAS domain S-box-containing protein
MKSSSSFTSALYPQENIKEHTRTLFDKLAIFAITFGAFPTIGSMLRISHYGWHPTIIIDVATYLLMITILLMRHLFPTMLVAILFIALLAINGCTAFFFSGLLTSNMSLVASCSIVAGVLFSYRAGVTVLIAAVVVIAVVGVLFSTGNLTYSFDMADYLVAPQSWIGEITSFFFFTLASLTVVHFIQNQLWNSFTALKDRSDKLHSSEKKYRLLAENMRDVLLLIDRDFRITYISPSVATVFGYIPAELYTKNIVQLTTRQHSEHLTFYLSHYMRQSRQLFMALPEFEFQRKDGSCFYAEFTPSLIINDAGEPEGVQGILRDLSEKKRVEKEKMLLEEQLRQAEKMQVIGQLAGGIAHDFNNQLAGIMGFAECIKADHPKNSETYSTAKAITGIVERASDLTGKLLAFARKGNYLNQVIDIHAIISEVAGILARSIDRSITIVQHLEASHSHIKGDPGQIQNALLNIALNGRDAMQKGGTLSFTTKITDLATDFTTPYQQNIEPGRYIHIAIADTGTGIPDATRRHLFEPFFTTKEPGKGTGMGLAAVYGTVQSHSGLLDVSSIEGSGTTFHIYFPVSTEIPDSIETPLQTELTRGTGSLLVVDDEISVGKMISMVLGRLGYTVKTTTNGADALALFKKQPDHFNGIVLDLVLPGMSGKELFRMFREIRKDLRILLCSGYSPDNDVQHFLNDDITYFIQKPFTMSELSEQLNRLLSKKG